MGADISNVTVADLAKLAQSLTVVGALIFALVGGYRKWWVWGYQMEECKEREKWWRELAMSNSTGFKEATQIARTAVQLVERKEG